MPRMYKKKTVPYRHVTFTVEIPLIEWLSSMKKYGITKTSIVNEGLNIIKRSVERLGPEAIFHFVKEREALEAAEQAKRTRKRRDVTNG